MIKIIVWRINEGLLLSYFWKDVSVWVMFRVRGFEKGY